MILRFGLALALLAAASSACSVPSLEDPRCADAQDSVKRFYSLHFDRNDALGMSSTAERPFLSDRLAEELEGKPAGPDYYTTGESFPKSFKVGACSLRGDDRAEVDVLLLWRNDGKSEQRPIQVVAVKGSDAWLIDSVATK